MDAIQKVLFANVLLLYERQLAKGCSDDGLRTTSGVLSSVNAQSWSNFYACCCDEYRDGHDKQVLKFIDGKEQPMRRAAMLMWRLAGGSDTHVGYSQRIRAVGGSRYTADYNKFLLAHVSDVVQLRDKYAKQNTDTVQSVSRLDRAGQDQTLTINIVTGAFEARVIAAIQQSFKKEINMTSTLNHKPLTKPTLLYGQNIKDIPSDGLLQHAVAIQAKISEYKGHVTVVGDSKFLQGRIKNLQDAAEAIKAELDSRPADE